MSRRLAARAIALALACAAAGAAAAQNLLPANEWIEASAPTAKSTLGGLPIVGARYHALARVPVTRGGAYTLLAEANDSRSLLVMVLGHDPREARAPRPPAGTDASASVNISGGRVWRINFRVDPRSEGDAAWVVLSSGEPGRRVRLMLKSPAEPDAVAAALVKGAPAGAVVSTPLYVAARDEAATAPGSAGAAALPFNRWVVLRAPAERTVLSAYAASGPLYHAVVPLRLQKGGRYTLFAEWDDGMAVLLEVRGHDPAAERPAVPSGALEAAALTISAGSSWRINFTVDPRSRGETAWLVFPSRQAGRTLRVMLKSPGDPDALTGAPVMGAPVGAVYRTPLYIACDRGL